MPIMSDPSFAEKSTTGFLTSRIEVSHRWIGSYAVFSSVLVTGRLHNGDTHLWVKPYLSKAACWWTVCFQWALALSSALLFLGWSSVLDSAWRLEISGREPEPPPCDTLSALHHQHDFHSCPRAGGAPSGKNKTNKYGGGRSASVQALFIWPCVSTVPQHLWYCRHAIWHDF